MHKWANVHLWTKREELGTNYTVFRHFQKFDEKVWNSCSLYEMRILNTQYKHLIHSCVQPVYNDLFICIPFVRHTLNYFFCPYVHIKAYWW